MTSRRFDTNDYIDAAEWIDDVISDIVPSEDYDEHGMFAGDIKITVEYIPAS